jgi:hypothetical protein
LEHLRFPDIFIRQTKKAYISFVDPEIIEFAKNGCDSKISYNAIMLASSRKRGIKMDMRFCRKIYASHLRQSGIESEIVDAAGAYTQDCVCSPLFYTKFIIS